MVFALVTKCIASETLNFPFVLKATDHMVSFIPGLTTSLYLLLWSGPLLLTCADLCCLVLLFWPAGRAGIGLCVLFPFPEWSKTSDRFVISLLYHLTTGGYHHIGRQTYHMVRPEKQCSNRYQQKSLLSLDSCPSSRDYKTFGSLINPTVLATDYAFANIV